MLQYIKDLFEAILRYHELLTIGTEFTPEDPNWGPLDIARIIKVDDAKGREHECILNISIGLFG
jgi:hypothetical protein